MYKPHHHLRSAVLHARQRRIWRTSTTSQAILVQSYNISGSGIVVHTHLWLSIRLSSRTPLLLALSSQTPRARPGALSITPPTHRLTRLFGASRPNSKRKNVRKKAHPSTQPTRAGLLPTISSTPPPAGVAQLVERVALITAKRSTSRSWVRAPPSAIPISKLIQSSCSFAFLVLMCM
jgi:hypothetical protein